MKNIIKSFLPVLAGIATFASASPLLAQINASPKYQSRLDEFKQHAPVTVAAMPCPKCQDKTALRVDYTARGANKPAVVVTTHQCGDCQTKWVTVGTGKWAQSVAKHDCGGDMACCDTK